MCINVPRLLGLEPSTPDIPDPPAPTQPPPLRAKNPDPPKAPPPPKLLVPEDKKPKVQFAKKKLSVARAKRVGSSDLKIPLQQKSAGGSTGGLNV